MTYLARLEYKRIYTEEIPFQTPSVPLKPMLEDLYLDWTNNYLSIDRMAQDYKVSGSAMSQLIEIGRAVYKANVTKEQLNEK